MFEQLGLSTARLHVLDIDGPGGRHMVEWTLERESVDLGALGRLMISGRIMLDGRLKIAIWNILDWRDPDPVMEKALALLSQGWDHVWVFAPGICKELELKKHDVKVVVFDRNVTRDNAEETFAGLLRLWLSPLPVTAPALVPRVEEQTSPEARLTAGVGVPEQIRPRQSIAERPITTKSLDRDVDSGWGQGIKEFLTNLDVLFYSQRRFPLSTGRAHYYTADFFVGKCGVVIEPHRDDRIDEDFEEKLRAFKREYPRYTVVLVTKERHDELIGDVCDNWALYDPPEFEELGSLLRKMKCVPSRPERGRSIGSASRDAPDSSGEGTL